jgi:hypothetical protein
VDVRTAVRNAASVSGADTHRPTPYPEATVRIAVRSNPDAGATRCALASNPMTSAERDQGAAPPIGERDAHTEEGPALRDADATAARVAADEAAAAAARERYRSEPMPAMSVDPEVATQLQSGEVVHDLRRRAMLKSPGDERALGYGGTLYLSSRRLLHIGQVVVSMQLTDIVETSLAGERLLVTLRDGEGFAFDLDRPREFRVGVAWATREARA